MPRYKASTAQPAVHLDQATSSLRRELRQLILEDDELSGLPDWTTLRVWGPFEVFDERGEIRYEYRGSVECRSKTELLARHQAALRPIPRPAQNPRGFGALAG